MSVAKKEILFSDFINGLSPTEASCAAMLDEKLSRENCKREMKEAASGYSVTYKSGADKKTVAAFICRKSGLKIRLTPPKPFHCDDFCAILPDNMKNDMKRGNDCKRLSGANVCNPHCFMGYAFTIDGAAYQKCRAMAFLFSVTEENLPYIMTMIQNIFESEK